MSGLVMPMARHYTPATEQTDALLLAYPCAPFVGICSGVARRDQRGARPPWDAIGSLVRGRYPQ
jgi:hypothetical protein